MSHRPTREVNLNGRLIGMLATALALQGEIYTELDDVTYTAYLCAAVARLMAGYLYSEGTRRPDGKKDRSRQNLIDCSADIKRIFTESVDREIGLLIAKLAREKPH